MEKRQLPEKLQTSERITLTKTRTIPKVVEEEGDEVDVRQEEDVIRIIVPADRQGTGQGR